MIVFLWSNVFHSFLYLNNFVMNDKETLREALSSTSVINFLQHQCTTPEDVARVATSLLQDHERNVKITKEKLETLAIAIPKRLTEVKNIELAELEKVTNIIQRIERIVEPRTSTSKVDTLALSQSLVPLFAKINLYSSAARYFEFYRDCCQLVSKTHHDLVSSPKSAMNGYRQLIAFRRRFSTDETCLSECKFLIDAFDKDITKLSVILKEHFSNELRDALKDLDWPKPIVTKSLDRFDQAFLNVVDWQQPDTLLFPPLFALRILAEPMLVRFSYHFERKDSPTNRLDRPEYMFTYVVNVVQEHLEFFRLHMTELFETFPLLCGYNPLEEFILILVNAIRKKLLNSLDSLLASPGLLAHTLVHVRSFCQTVQSLFDVDLLREIKERQSHGNLYDILVSNPEIFHAFMDIEKRAAHIRYKRILNDPKAWDRNDDDLATNSSKEIVDIFEDLTERYMHIPSLFHKVLFFENVQRSALHEYAEEIQRSMEQFAVAWGIKNIQQACQVARLANSSYHLISSIDLWKSDKFFLELEYYEHYKRSFSDDTTSPSGVDGLIQKLHGATLFNDLLKIFNNLLDRGLELMIQWTFDQLTKILKNYKKRFQQQDTPISLPCKISTHMYDFLDTSKEVIGSLQLELMDFIYKKFFELFVYQLDDLFLKKIILSITWERQEYALQMICDLQALKDVLVSYSREDVELLPWTFEALQLLGLSRQNEVSAFSWNDLLSSVEAAPKEHLMDLLRDQLSVRHLSYEQVVAVVNTCI